MVIVKYIFIYQQYLTDVCQTLGEKIPLLGHFDYLLGRTHRHGHFYMLSYIYAMVNLNHCIANPDMLY